MCRNRFLFDSFSLMSTEVPFFNVLPPNRMCVRTSGNDSIVVESTGNARKKHWKKKKRPNEFFQQKIEFYSNHSFDLMREIWHYVSNYIFVMDRMDGWQPVSQAQSFWFPLMTGVVCYLFGNFQMNANVLQKELNHKNNEKCVFLTFVPYRVVSCSVRPQRVWTERSIL